MTPSYARGMTQSERDQIAKTVRLAPELNSRLETQSDKMGVSQGYLIRRALEELLTRNEKAVNRLADPVMGAIYRNLMTWASKGLEPERADELVAVVKKIEDDITASRADEGGTVEPA